MSTKLALCTKKAKYNWLFCAAKSRRRRWRLAGAGGHERSRAASRPVHCSICWMPTCRRDFAIISSLRDGSCQWPSDFAHVPRTVPYTVLLLYFATPLTHCPEQPGLLTFGLPDSPTGKRTAGCSAQRSQGGSAGDQPVPGDMSEAEQPAGPCIAPVAGCRVAVATSRSLQVCGIVQVNGRATSLMSPGPCPTRSSSFTSLRRSPTALNNQACSLSDCPIHQPARERLAVLRSEVKEEALAISQRRGP